MSGKLLIVGAGSRVGGLLRRQGELCDGAVWLSRNGPGAGWRVEDGAAGLEPYLEGVAAVFCLAGATPRGGVDFGLNTQIALAVVDAAARAAALPRVFLASSMAVYGDGEGPHREAGPVGPVGDYGRSKLEMERQAAARGRGLGVGVTALRLGNVVGADLLFENVAAGRSIVLDRFADGATPVRSYLDPGVLARCLVALTGMAGGELPDVLNLATDPPVAMAALLGEAGVAYSTRAAPEVARQSVTMDLTNARAWLPVLAARRDARGLVAAWRRAEAPS